MTYLERYNIWLKNAKDPEIVASLKTMTEKEKLEAFSTELEFGTGGLRGIMGPGTNRVNIYTIRKATLGYAKYLNNHFNNSLVVIAYDNRLNSQLFAREAASVLEANNIKTMIFSELRPTPMLSFAVRWAKCQGGIMITASHNPKTYNGYKVYNSNGAQLDLDEASEVISYINKVEDVFLENNIKYTPTFTPVDLENDYLELVKKIGYHHTTKQAKLVYSPLHGTGGPVIPKFLSECGYQVFPYMPQMENEPTFKATKSSNPEEAIAYEGTIAYGNKINADAIMLTDPDADRLGIAVWHNGQYVLLTGNQTASIELEYILSNEKDLKTGYVFTTNVTTDLINKIATSYHVNVVTTLTGFKFIGKEAAKIENTGRYLFGCEESYGSLIKDFVRDKDAVQAVYLLSEIINYQKDRNLTLIDYLDEIYAKYGYHFEYTENVVHSNIEGIMSFFRNHILEIPGLILNKFEDLLVGGSIIEKLSYPKANVLKYYFDDLWIVIRPSGTEPKLKIYFGSTASNKEKAIEKINKAKECILKLIWKIEEVM